MEIKKTHIGAYGVIVKDNKIALIKKARGGYKGKLDLPGGGIEHTETPIATLKRELMEEINGTVISAKLLDTTAVNIKWEFEPNSFEDLHHIGVLYSVEIEQEKLKEDSDGLDSDGADWYLISDLEEGMLSPLAWYSLKLLGFK